MSHRLGAGGVGGGGSRYRPAAPGQPLSFRESPERDRAAGGGAAAPAGWERAGLPSLAAPGRPGREVGGRWGGRLPRSEGAGDSSPGTDVRSAGPGLPPPPLCSAGPGLPPSCPGGSEAAAAGPAWDGASPAGVGWGRGFAPGRG